MRKEKEEELMEFICDAVLKEPDISKSEMENPSSCGKGTSYKNGIFFLFNDEGEVIYIGKVGGTRSTSLYNRIDGHGSGSLSKNAWYSEVAKGKFHRFDGCDGDELDDIKQLAIRHEDPYYCRKKIDIESLYGKLMP